MLKVAKNKHILTIESDIKEIFSFESRCFMGDSAELESLASIHDLKCGALKVATLESLLIQLPPSHDFKTVYTLYALAMLMCPHQQA